MDVARFAAELPRLFEEFPHSERPRGRRYDDIASSVPNLAMENNLALIGLAASLLAPGDCYVEAGTYMGASLIAAARGNEAAKLVGIDDFSFPVVHEIDRTLPPASRSELEANLERYGVGATILEGDTNEILRSEALAGRPVGVFYYDACHDYEPQLEALRLVERFLAEPALLIVDDSEWESVRTSVHDYVAGRPRVGLLFEIPGREAGHPHWWHGMTILSFT